MEDEKEEQRVTKGDREEKMREKKGKRGKVALQHSWGTNFMWREALLLLVWTLPYQHLKCTHKCTQGISASSTLNTLRWP
jgi:cell division septal protein FtsQ